MGPGSRTMFLPRRFAVKATACFRGAESAPSGALPAGPHEFGKDPLCLLPLFASAPG